MISSRLVRRLAAGAVGMAAVVLLAPAAQAHDHLLSSTPANGSTLSAPLDTVELVFSQPVSRQGVGVVVRDPSGATLQAGAPVVVGTTVSQVLAALPTTGAYTLDYRIVSTDGHPITGTMTFEVAAGAVWSPTAPDPDPATEPDPAVTEPDPAVTEPAPAATEPAPAGPSSEAPSGSGTDLPGEADAGEPAEDGDRGVPVLPAMGVGALGMLAWSGWRAARARQTG